jgi:RNA-splicing ligase RtcB
MRRWVLVAAAAALINGSTASPCKADESALEQVLIESATTPAQHEALARYYDAKAASARAASANHRSIAKAYAAGKFAEVVAMKDHCEKLAALYEEQATQFEELAEMQRKLRM